MKADKRGAIRGRSALHQLWINQGLASGQARPRTESDWQKL